MKTSLRALIILEGMISGFLTGSLTGGVLWLAFFVHSPTELGFKLFLVLTLGATAVGGISGLIRSNRKRANIEVKKTGTMS